MSLKGPKGPLQIPCIVAGAGGYTKLGPLQKVNGAYPKAPLAVGAASRWSNTTSNFGFLRLEVSKTQILGTYMSAPYSTRAAQPQAWWILSPSIWLKTQYVPVSRGGGGGGKSRSQRLGKAGAKSGSASPAEWQSCRPQTSPNNHHRGGPSFAFLGREPRHRAQRVQLTTIYGFKTTLPNIWLFSRYSWAARISHSGNVRSTTGFRRPAKTWPRTSYSSSSSPCMNLAAATAVRKDAADRG